MLTTVTLLGQWDFDLSNRMDCAAAGVAALPGLWGRHRVWCGLTGKEKYSAGWEAWPTIAGYASRVRGPAQRLCITREVRATFGLWTLAV